MKNEKLFNETVDILVKAYQKGTLQHGSCYACAVGNLICYRTGRKIVTDNMWSRGLPVWDHVFFTARGTQETFPNKYFGCAKEQIDSTGYIWEDLAKIEFAFESARCGTSDDEYMFNGLMSVVDCLMEIHEADIDQCESAKKLFVKELC